MRVSVEKCEHCSEERVAVSMSRDEAEMLASEYPDDPSAYGAGDIPYPMMELFGKRLKAALGTREV